MKKTESQEYRPTTPTGGEIQFQTVNAKTPQMDTISTTPASESKGFLMLDEATKTDILVVLGAVTAAVLIFHHMKMMKK